MYPQQHMHEQLHFVFVFQEEIIRSTMSSLVSHDTEAETVFCFTSFGSLQQCT